MDDKLESPSPNRLVYTHSAVDDFGLTPNAFRVYCHLCRRAGKDNRAFPSHESIGEVCFSSISDSANWRFRLSVKAVNELLARGMITKTLRSRRSTLYEITTRDQWKA